MKHAPLKLLLLVTCLAVLPDQGHSKHRDNSQASTAETTDDASNLADRTKLEKSFAKWQILRDDCQGNYSYTTGRTSFSGHRSETIVIVKNHRISERRHRSYSPFERMDASGRNVAPGWTEHWTERGQDVGRHRNGAPGLTLDELYAKAQQVVEHPLTESEQRGVAVDERGLLKSCVYVDVTVLDDAPIVGVVIQNLQLDLPKQAIAK